MVIVQLTLEQIAQAKTLAISLYNSGMATGIEAYHSAYIQAVGQILGTS